jgi:hypothetical protein
MPRGSEFTARWNEGAWAELRIIEAFNREPDLIAVQYGITNGEAFWSTREMAARALPNQTEHGKRPDVLVFDRREITAEEQSIAESICMLDDAACEAVVRKAKFAIESEFSPYNYAHRRQHYPKGKLSFTIKEEDLQPTIDWYTHFDVEIGIAQIFLDSAFMLPVSTLISGIADGSIKRQFERSYSKYVYYPPLDRGIIFGVFSEPPSIMADVILTPYGKYEAFRKVTGGLLTLSDDVRALLK